MTGKSESLSLISSRSSEALKAAKHWEQQPRIVKEVLHSRKFNSDLHSLVKGVMIESYLEDGNQKVGGGCFGKSITDPCLGWEKTEQLLYEIADLI